VDQTIGKRLKDAKTIGIPYIVVIGKSIVEQNVEFHDTKRGTMETFHVQDIARVLYDHKYNDGLQQ